MMKVSSQLADERSKEMLTLLIKTHVSRASHLLSTLSESVGIVISPHIAHAIIRKIIILFGSVTGGFW
ncbi:MAG: hypothetical protein L0220_28995 [Acidobacteria bacterium]|nr:hypothetical protein [Acidobacteriota bacterium]